MRQIHQSACMQLFARCRSIDTLERQEILESEFKIVFKGSTRAGHAADWFESSESSLSKIQMPLERWRCKENDAGSGFIIGLIGT